MTIKRNSRTQATVKLMMESWLVESIPLIPSFREKEWAMEQLDHLREGGTLLPGQKRQLKATGITRPVDELGRLVIPIELRRKQGWVEDQEVEISLDEVNKWVVIERHKDRCTFCGSDKDIQRFKHSFVCETCLSQMVQEL